MKPYLCLLLAALVLAGCDTSSPRVDAQQAVLRQEADIRQLQTVLGALGYDPGGVDGTVGPRTRAAVRRSQADFGLPATGEADARLLALGERHLEENPPHPDWPTTAQVFALQRGLKRIGYYDGPIDGRFSGETLRGLLLYQRRNRLPITQTVEPGLLARIEREAAARPGSG